jgi:hypothetical protein
VVTICDHLARLKFSHQLPYAFSEHGAFMLANVLNSERASQTSVQIVRVFVRLRQMLSSNAELARKMAGRERKYDSQFKVVFDAIRQLMSPPVSRRREIGFHVKHDGNKPKSKSDRRYALRARWRQTRNGLPKILNGLKFDQ